LDCLVLIPTYNEAENVEAIARAVLGQGERFGVLIIDDNSPDGTGRLADELALVETRVRVLHRPAKRGLGPAYLQALGQVLGEGGVEYVVTMDADFSHDPGDLPRLLAAAEAGADWVIGSRYCPGGGVRNWGLGRRLISRLGGGYARLLLGLEVADPTAGFNLIRLQALARLNLAAIRSNGYGYLIEFKHRGIRAGLNLTEVPIVFTERRVGQSKMSFRIALEAFTLVLRLALDGR